jgi:phage FluMu protein Com
MNDCLCCSDQLLRHISHNRIYWFCPRCRQEMPVADTTTTYLHKQFQIRKTLNDMFSQRSLITTL